MKTTGKLKTIALTMLIATSCIAFTACSSDDDGDDEFKKEENNGNVNNSIDSNGHEYVDLGLSVYWATCNIGAYSPTMDGFHYAFGESVIKTDYTKKNYKGGNKDAAQHTWGGTWRLPISKEVNELISNCSWKTFTIDGKDYTKAISKKNGNSIIFPYAGSKVNGTGDKGGFFWSSTTASDNSAWCLYISTKEIQCAGAYKYCGLSIRPVMTNPYYKKSDEGTDTGSSSGSGTGTMTYEKPDVAYHDFTAYQTRLKVVYKIWNNDKAKVTSAKIYYGTTSNPTKYVSASVSSALITGNISGLKKGTTYYVKCVATGKGGTTTTSTTKLMTNN